MPVLYPARAVSYTGLLCSREIFPSSEQHDEREDDNKAVRSTQAHDDLFSASDMIEARYGCRSGTSGSLDC
jgi:hypothetical protein